tara:strand:+ start:538 stop:822 length:285 start_codon:yes stop_codon:yes gene_type:complete
MSYQIFTNTPSFCKFIQKGRYLHIIENGTESLLGKYRGQSPEWHDYKRHDWSNDKQCYIDLDPPIKNTYTIDDLQKAYDARSEEGWVRSHMMDW